MYKKNCFYAHLFVHMFLLISQQVLQNMTPNLVVSASESLQCHWNGRIEARSPIYGFDPVWTLITKNTAFDFFSRKLTKRVTSESATTRKTEATCCPTIGSNEINLQWNVPIKCKAPTVLQF